MHSQGSSIGTHRPFIPSNAVLGNPPVLTLDNARRAVIAGMTLNPNYKGTLTTFHIENANTTALENCSIRIHGIHPDATIKEILGEIHTGKIYSVNRCPPEVGKIETAAADIVFLTRAAAEAFINEAKSGIYIRGKPLFVGWNRNRVREPKNISPEDSRVVRITGPEHVLSVEMLEDLFRQYFRFELVDTRTWQGARGQMTFELTFESIHPQATWARRVFKQHFEVGRHSDFHIRFGPDPCEDPTRLVEGLERQSRLALSWRRGEAVDDKVERPTHPQIWDKPWRQL